MRRIRSRLRNTAQHGLGYWPVHTL